MGGEFIFLGNIVILKNRETYYNASRFFILLFASKYLKKNYYSILEYQHSNKDSKIHLFVLL